MFKNTFQSGFLSVLYSIGSKPLQLWNTEVDEGHIKVKIEIRNLAETKVKVENIRWFQRVQDSDIQSSVIEVEGENVANNYITCPMNASDSLGIKLPYIVFVVKNMNKYFSFEIQIKDDKNIQVRINLYSE